MSDRLAYSPDDELVIVPEGGDLAEYGMAPIELPDEAKKSANRPGAGLGASVVDMANAPYYRLKIKSLKFISAVDAGAQGPVANVALIKRAPTGTDVEAVCHVSKVDEKLGLVFGWALATTLDGGATPHVDLQKDAILGGDDLIKVAAAFMERGGPSDVLHDENPDGKVVFALPITKDVAAALGLKSEVHGLAIAMRPSPETFERFVKGELNAFSIGGIGERELVEKAQPKCPSCGAYGKADDKVCKSCGKTMKRAEPDVAKGVWSTADVDSLPDSSFLYIESGGSKDSEGKTTPRSLRHFPYKDSNGTVDLPHLRDAIGRIPQSSLPKDLRDKLQVKAEKLLAAQHDKANKRFTKQAILTSSDQGHQHQLDLDDPADQWFGDKLRTSDAVADGADISHSHDWVFDATTGKITIAESAGHSHTVDSAVPPDVLRQAALNSDGERCTRCGQMCESDCRFCPNCGAAMDSDVSDGVPMARDADEDSDSHSAQVVIVAARAGDISTPSEGTPTVKSDKEPIAMADPNDRIKTLEAENAQLKKMASLTDAQRAHISKLDETEATNFLNMNSSQRDAILAEIAKADEVVYESPFTKRVYRKSSPLEVVEAAREADASKAAREQLEIAKRELEFTKRGETVLKSWPMGAKRDLRARIIKAIDGEFKDAAEHDEAIRALKSADFAIEQQMTAKGVTPNLDPNDIPQTPKAQLDALTAEYAKAHNVPVHKAAAAVLETPAGAALYAKLPVGHA